MSVIGKAVSIMQLNNKPFYLYKDGVFSPLLGNSNPPFYCLSGTAGGTNTDTLVLGSSYTPYGKTIFVYTEMNNDYGGIISMNPISFSGYDYLRIIFSTIASWQDSSFKAAVYFLTYTTRSVGASGFSTYTTRALINPDGNYNGTMHLAQGRSRFEVVMPLSYYQSQSYYLGFTCASGSVSGIPYGEILIEEMTLEKGGNGAYNLPKIIWDGYDKYAYVGGCNHPWEGGACGGFTTLQGTANSQTDSISWNVASGSGPYLIEYYEQNNDYGGFRTNNPISFSGYSKLHIEMPYLDSWQDTNYYACVCLSTTAQTKTASTGYLSSYNLRQFIDQKAGAQELHIRESSYNITVDITNYNLSYYIYVLCARGNSASVRGICKVSKIWLDND